MKKTVITIKNFHKGTTYCSFNIEAPFKSLQDLFLSVEGWEPTPPNEFVPDIDSEYQYELELCPGEDYYIALYGTKDPSCKQVFQKYITKKTVQEFTLFVLNINNEILSSANKYYKSDQVSREIENINKLSFQP